jgi:RNA polymerase sigma-70 factor (ECF subfamily)
MGEGHLPEAMLVAHTRDAVPEIEAEPLDIGEVFAQHSNFVWRTLQRLGVRDADLEDVAQEVFLVVGQRLHEFEHRSRITTWLYGISLRVASTHRRRAWVRREIPSSDRPDAPDLEGGPEEALETARKRQDLQAILGLMGLERRALLVMYELDEMSCEEIAEVLGVPTGTVHSRLSAAREEFRAAMKRHSARSRTPFVLRWFGRKP